MRKLVMNREILVAAALLLALVATAPAALAEGQIGAEVSATAKTDHADTTGLAASRPAGQISTGDAALAAKGDLPADRRGMISAGRTEARAQKGQLSATPGALAAGAPSATGKQAPAAGELPRPSRPSGKVAAALAGGPPNSSKRQQAAPLAGSLEAALSADKSIVN